MQTKLEVGNRANHGPLRIWRRISKNILEENHPLEKLIVVMHTKLHKGILT